MERMEINHPTWLKILLEEESITDLCLNGPSNIFLDQGNGMERFPLDPMSSPWTDASYKEWVLELLSVAGKSWDAKHPFVDATLPIGFRLHLAFPPLSPQGILVSLRRLPKSTAVQRWTDSPFFAPLLEAAQRGESILIAGATGSGKTTLANDLLSGISHQERLVALEDTPELAPAHPHFLTLLSRTANADGFGSVSLRDLLRQTLRMRPDRIILGECRGDEVLELLQALNTGHRGSLATVHANSCRDALRRVELLCMLASKGGLPPLLAKELLANGLQWIAFVQRIGARRQISEVQRIEGCDGGTILTRPMLKWMHHAQG